MEYVDHPFKSPRVLSLCTGIGGIERGLKRAIGPIRTVAYVEIEAFIIENLLVGMEAGLVDAAPIWANLKTFPAQEFRGAVDGIIGGYPCQPFSTAGNRRGADDPRHLWPYIRKSIEAIRPVWCLFENVAGHLSLGYGEVYRSLRDMGYAVEAGIYTAEEVGAPHQRKRLFILAIATRELQQWRRHARGWRDEFANSGQQLADTNSSSAVGNIGNILCSGSKNEAKAWERQWSGDEFSDISEKMVNAQGIGEREQADKANTQPDEGGARPESSVRRESLADEVGQRLEGFRSRKIGAEPEIPLSTGIGYSQFPARPGEHQYEWEHPRTIEPGMGCTIDGYNFREDILRALGNSVVEQTAELAFIDLLKKHLW